MNGLGGNPTLYVKNALSYSIGPLYLIVKAHSYIIVNSTNQNAPINTMLYGQNLEEVYSFKYLGSTWLKQKCHLNKIN